MMSVLLMYVKITMNNRLQNALSPYLQQHQTNPVDWHPWGTAALRLAQKSDRPIFLSIGYAACHWCHVMAHECFADQQVADQLNQYFVAIKVDREERPDLDHLYMQALLQLQGQGGWPMSLFLLPDGTPFFGGTYFPKQSQPGMIGFLDLLQHIQQLWVGDRDQIMQVSKQMTQILAQKQIGATPVATGMPVIDLPQMVKAVFPLLDEQQGGLRGAPKFPQVPLWLWLTQLAAITQDSQLQTVVELTATQLCRGGIYDHLGGGWMRYSTDDHWLVPHFEKMLYDNALLLQWLAKLSHTSAKNLYKCRIAQTVDWLQKTMQLEDDVFCSSLDADSQGQEGQFYVWSEVEIDHLLTTQAAEFCKQYGVSRTGNWEGHNILHQNHLNFDRSRESMLAPLLVKLQQQREQRVHPDRDDKVLTDWNAMLITGLAMAGMMYRCDTWIKLAQQTFTALQQRLYRDEQWLHAYRGQQYTSQGFLDDYAAIIEAALTLHCVTGQVMYLEKARQWTLQAEQLFEHPKLNLFQQTSIHAEPLFDTPIIFEDQATPNGNAIMALNYAYLWWLTHERSYYETGTKLIAELLSRTIRYPVIGGTVLRAQDLMNYAMVIQGPFTTLTEEAHQLLIKGAVGRGILIHNPHLHDIKICIDQQCQTITTDAQSIDDFLH